MTAPFLFTRNLQITSLNPKPDEMVFEGPPFDDRAFAYVTRGGAAFALLQADLKEGDAFLSLPVLDPVSSQPLTNRVLRP